VTSIFKSGTTHFSNAVSVSPVELIAIISTPPTSGVVNSLYTYQVTATSTQSGVILKYALAAKPDRMSIDSVSGLIKWIPLQRGSFKVGVLVTSSAGGKAEQVFVVTVTGPAGTVEGLITGPNNEPVANVAVLLMRKTSTLTPQYKSYTDRIGKFAITGVDSGSYLARAIPTIANYAEQWYDGVTSAERATAVAVKPNTTTTINFKLVSKGDAVQISSRPTEAASIRVLWTYQILASSTDPTAMLKYQLSYKPEGMSIDSAKGLISWNPAARGTFKVVVLVLSSKGGRGEQSFTITVTGPTGMVSGVVKDTLGKGVPGVYVQLYQTNGAYVSVEKTLTDSEGKYTIAKVDSGKYFARAIPSRSDFAEQWYDGVTELGKATSILVLPNQITSVNFILKAKPVPLQFTVRGSVLDESRKVPREATVFFTAPVTTMTDPVSSILPAEIAYKVRVDTSGKYSVKLPQNTYIVMASAPGYTVLYFNGKPDALTATPLKLTKDTSGIDFVLKAVSPAAVGKISGSVVDSTGKGLKAKVVAYRLLTTKLLIDGPGVYPGETDSTGKFIIANLAAGDYIVFAMPIGAYAPTYYSQNGSTTSWERATKISVNGTTVTGITIVAKPLVKGTNGRNTINGVVSVSGESVQSMGSQGAAGAIIYAMLNVDVAGYGIADEAGNFSIEELDPGQYTLVVDKVNFTPISTAKASSIFNTSLEAMNAPPTAYLTLSPTVVTAIDENSLIPTELVLEQNYPNPFNPRTAISFQLSADSWMTLKVYDMLGREIETLVSGFVTAGRHTVTWNGQNDRGEALSSGVYLYRLTVGSSVVTRRMVLLK
jgi:hypothetical protein